MIIRQIDKILNMKKYISATKKGSDFLLGTPFRTLLKQAHRTTMDRHGKIFLTSISVENLSS